MSEAKVWCHQWLDTENMFYLVLMGPDGIEEENFFPNRDALNDHINDNNLILCDETSQQIVERINRKNSLLYGTLCDDCKMFQDHCECSPKDSALIIRAKEYELAYELFVQYIQKKVTPYHSVRVRQYGTKLTFECWPSEMQIIYVINFFQQQHNFTINISTLTVERIIDVLAVCFQTLETSLTHKSISNAPQL